MVSMLFFSISFSLNTCVKLLDGRDLTVEKLFYLKMLTFGSCHQCFMSEKTVPPQGNFFINQKLNFLTCLLAKFRS